MAAWLAQRRCDLALYDAHSGTLDFGPQPWLRRPNVLAIAQNAGSKVADRLRDAPLHPQRGSTAALGGRRRPASGCLKTGGPPRFL